MIICSIFGEVVWLKQYYFHFLWTRTIISCLGHICGKSATFSVFHVNMAGKLIMGIVGQVGTGVT